MILIIANGLYMSSTPEKQHFQFGIGSYALAWSVGIPGKEPTDSMSIFDLMDFARNIGVFLVQVDDNLPLQNCAEDTIKEVVDYAIKQDISVEIGSKRLTKEHTLRYLEIAKQFEAPFLRMVIDDGDYQPGVKEIIKLIKEMIPEFEAAGIPLAIENHDRFKAVTFKQIIDEVGSDYLKICLDSVNSIGAGEGLETVSTVLAPYTINLHLKEFEARRIWHKLGFTIEGKPLGQGQLPVQQLLDQVRPYCRSVTLELWPPPEDKVEDTIRKEQQWVRESVQYWNEHFKNY